jgi:hypothetical protein
MGYVIQRLRAEHCSKQILISLQMLLTTTRRLNDLTMTVEVQQHEQ